MPITTSELCAFDTHRHGVRQVYTAFQTAAILLLDPLMTWIELEVDGRAIL